MPKYNLIISPHKRLEPKFEDLLKSIFKEKELERLMKMGGRLQISLTVPFNDKRKKSINTVIDNEFVEKLLNDAASAEEILEDLSKKKLGEIVKLLKIPISSKSNIKEVRVEILKYLKFPEVWKDISS